MNFNFLFFINSNKRSLKKISNFNTYGYAAPKLKPIRIGFVGSKIEIFSARKRMTYIEGAEINIPFSIHPFHNTLSNTVE